MCRDVLPELLFGWSAVSGQNLYPVDVVRAVGGYRETMSLCEDRDLWTRVATRGPVVLVPLVTVDYRYNLGQTRPHWVSFTRARVALRCASTLPPERRTRALAWVRSGRFVENAERSLSLGQYLRGVRLAAAGIAQAPGLFLSPLIGEWVLRRLAGRVARRLVSPLTMSA
jgi:hypothetical protein